MSGAAIRRGYSDTPQGQIHWRMLGKKAGAADLYCLHPAPFSGLAFTEIMPYLAQLQGSGRRVIAPDFPGHGGSDPFLAEPSIADYAQAMLAVIGDLSGGGPVAVLGFHTGCLVAAEMALLAPEMVGRLVLIDVPAFTPQIRREQLASSAQPPEITPELASIAPMWERGITRRLASQSIERAFALFTEHMRHGSAMHAGFYAGFTYELEARLPQVTHPTTIIASQSGLLDATRRSAMLMPSATLVERLDITRAVLDQAAPETAKSVLEALK